MKLARQIVGTAPLSRKIVKHIKPASDVVSDADLVEHLRQRVELIYHPVGTCRMGKDDLAVVDPETRVRGLEGLRVVDASIMPVIPGGNTNAPTMMVAERASDLIKGRTPTAAGAAT
jgi:choline dehydrogenase-like flavoprotein